MRGAEGLIKMPRKNKRWHDRTKKREYNIGDKMLMNSSSKESFKQEEKTTTSYLTLITWCHHTPMVFRRLPFDLGIHINEETKHV